jgi:hypothetical protein
MLPSKPSAVDPQMKHIGEHASLVASALLNRAPLAANLRASESWLASLPRQHITDLLIDAVNQACNHQPDIYLSTPITGGPRLYAFLQSRNKRSKAELSPEEVVQYTQQVVKQNCTHAHAVAELLRQGGRSVIEPSQIGIPGWNQAHYNENWTAFVRELHLKELHVCDGWQLSYGCLLEVRAALDKGLPVLDESGKQLDRQQATRAVQRAVEQVSFPLATLTKVLTAPMHSLPLEI